MNGLLLDGLDTQELELLVEDLTQIHNNRLMDLLPQMGTEDLDEGDLEGRNFAVQEYTGQIELDLETDIDVGTTGELANGSIGKRWELIIYILKESCQFCTLRPD